MALHRTFARTRGVRWLLLSIVCIGCNACATGGYLIHVASGQFRILVDSVPIAAQDLGLLTRHEKQNLVLLGKALDFAEEVGLNRSGQFSKFYGGDPTAAVWVITAAPSYKPELHTWYFPIAGRVPYLGFFSRELALRKASELREQGFETNVRTASAYSTLGWFEDPLFRAQLQASPLRFVSTIFHELVHATAYRKGDTPWNETIASFTEDKILELFVERHPEISTAQLARHRAGARDGKRLQEKVVGLKQTLLELYAQDATAYARDHTATIEEWSAALSETTWEVYDGAALARKEFTVPQLLGAGLYFDETVQLDEAWDALTPDNPIALNAPELKIRLWLELLAICADETEIACPQ